jgi:hypothetical protein
METTNVDCVNYINVNWDMVIPMTEAEFRARNFEEIREIVHGVGEGRFLVGIGNLGRPGVYGYFDFQRGVSACAPGTNPV